ncbi:hypothetical protein R5H32_17000 [Defluviimonas sp. D31]|uniref:hypothetical protein n=1 Tax=Defluviimonas sp. D31 TaxID=3083253 RepID=UPI00296E368B|nr:hypothetical protein [Defluviimonas sp. D31]MDW4551062.1 hypothetical protein [Defluviimonas sp. D31]
MLHEILYNATVPGAFMNALDAAKERDRQNKRYLTNDRRFEKSVAGRASRRATFWARIRSLYIRPAQGDVSQMPAE